MATAPTGTSTASRRCISTPPHGTSFTGAGRTGAAGTASAATAKSVACSSNASCVQSSRLAKRRTDIPIETLALLHGDALNGDDTTTWFRRRVSVRQLEPGVPRVVPAHGAFRRYGGRQDAHDARLLALGVDSDAFALDGDRAVAAARRPHDPRAEVSRRDARRLQGARGHIRARAWTGVEVPRCGRRTGHRPDARPTTGHRARSMPDFLRQSLLDFQAVPPLVVLVRLVAALAARRRWSRSSTG